MLAGSGKLSVRTQRQCLLAPMSSDRGCPLVRARFGLLYALACFDFVFRSCSLYMFAIVNQCRSTWGKHRCTPAIMIQFDSDALYLHSLCPMIVRCCAVGRRTAAARRPLAVSNKMQLVPCGAVSYLIDRVSLKVSIRVCACWRCLSQFEAVSCVRHVILKEPHGAPSGSFLAWHKSDAAQV